MPLTQTLIPYEFSWDVRLRAIDPYDPTQEDLSLTFEERGPDDEGLQLLDLSRDHTPWRELELQLRADIPQTELDRVLPGSSSVAKDTALLVSVHCASTMYRRSVQLDTDGPTSWFGSTRLRREDVRDLVELHPLLVRSTELPGGETRNVAVYRGATIATGRSVRIGVDRIEHPIKGAPRIEWDDFRDSTNRWRKAHAADLFYFEGDPTRPVLWLNSHYAQMRELLHQAGDRGVDAALRKLTELALAQQVWTAMFVCAVASIEQDEETGAVRYPAGWKRDVLETMLPITFPDTLVEEDRLRDAARALKSGDLVGPFVATLGSAVQDAIGSAQLFQAAIRAAEIGGGK